MTKHPDYCPNFNGGLEELAHEIDNMTHEAKTSLFRRLYELAVKREKEELALGREKYYRRLSALVTPGLKMAYKGEEACWEVCKKFTEVEKR